MNPAPTYTTRLKVQIYSTSAVLETIEVDALSSKNSVGEFSVLPNHAQLITLIRDSKILFYKGGEVIQVLSCKRAVIHIKDNTVNVFTDIAGPEDLDKN